MNGLASRSPSQSAVRLALGGFLLLIVQNGLLLLHPDFEGEVRGLISVLTLISLGALVAALVGPPEPPTDDWRRRYEH